MADIVLNVICLSSLRVDLVEAKSSLTRLNAEFESRRAYHHDRQLEHLRALQVTTTVLRQQGQQQQQQQ